MRAVRGTVFRVTLTFCSLPVLSCFTGFLGVRCGRGRYRSSDLRRKNVKSLQGVAG